MKRKTGIILGIIAAFLLAGGLLWHFLPVRVLKNMEAEQVASIMVTNSGSGNQFEITDREEIAGLLSSVHQLAFRKKEIASVPGPWYRLDFIDQNRETAASLELQNDHAVRYQFAGHTAVFLYSKDEMKELCDVLQKTEAVYFPDCSKDPDFPYEN